jgi:hypothetical protein
VGVSNIGARNRKKLSPRVAPSPPVGIAGFDQEKRLRFRGKDHSQRPATSTKRLGRRRGPGGGGVKGLYRRIKAEMEAR